MATPQEVTEQYLRPLMKYLKLSVAISIVFWCKHDVEWAYTNAVLSLTQFPENSCLFWWAESIGVAPTWTELLFWGSVIRWKKTLEISEMQNLCSVACDGSAGLYQLARWIRWELKANPSDEK